MSALLNQSQTSGHDADVSIVADAFVPHAVLASIDLSPLLGTGPERTAPGSITDLLHASERAFASTLPDHRRVGWVAGRRVMRAALQQISATHAAHPLLATPRGAPSLPHGVSGSISHKRTRAIAIAASTTDTFWGIDLEERPGDADLARPSIGRRILTAHEQDAIADLDALALRETTLVYFALKEAVYKAIDPLVQRYVRFTEVELDVHANGSAVVRLLMPELVARGLEVEAHWRVDGQHIVAMARTLPR